MYAREVAKELPYRVRSVITFGAAFAGSHKSTNAWRLYKLTNGRKIEQASEHYDLPVAPTVPTSSICSRSDGLVAWQASIQAPDQAKPVTENIEFIASRIGLGLNASACRAMADHLAQAEGDWKSFAEGEKPLAQ